MLSGADIVLLHFLFASEHLRLHDGQCNCLHQSKGVACNLCVGCNFRIRRVASVSARFADEQLVLCDGISPGDLGYNDLTLTFVPITYTYYT